MECWFIREAGNRELLARLGLDAGELGVGDHAIGIVLNTEDRELLANEEEVRFPIGEATEVGIEVRAMSAADGLVGLVLEQLEVVGLLVDLEAHAVEGDKCVCTHGLCAPNSARFIGDGQEGVRGLALT